MEEGKRKRFTAWFTATLPAWCTTASKALVVRCVVTDAIILTGIGETRGQHVLTVPACRERERPVM